MFRACRNPETGASFPAEEFRSQRLPTAARGGEGTGAEATCTACVCWIKDGRVPGGAKWMVGKLSGLEPYCRDADEAGCWQGEESRS